MDMPSAIVSVLTKYASFSGRASCSEYWWFALAYIILVVIVFCIDIYGLKFGYSGASSIVLFALFLPNLALSVRRLHDIGKSGWNILWAYQPYVAAIFVLVFAVNPVSMFIHPGSYLLLWLLALPVGPIMIFVWACKKGDLSDNDYGPNPLDEYEQEYAY